MEKVIFVKVKYYPSICKKYKKMLGIEEIKFSRLRDLKENKKMRENEK